MGIMAGGAGHRYADTKTFAGREQSILIGVYIQVNRIDVRRVGGEIVGKSISGEKRKGRGNTSHDPGVTDGANVQVLLPAQGNGIYKGCLSPGCHMSRPRAMTSFAIHSIEDLVRVIGRSNQLFCEGSMAFHAPDLYIPFK